jgi:hypothetical protein
MGRPPQEGRLMGTVPSFFASFAMPFIGMILLVLAVVVYDERRK